VTKLYFAYVRVSTTRQGQTGTSLAEQRAAISRHAQRYGLTIIKEYEEQETAAKRGRPIFAEMIRALRQSKASGVVMHKIDRSARNLKDWADLGELIDSGVEVHFANEGLDLHSRGGRLSADIQAVVAADYIRNLREETKKGFYGRLKQGLYPMPAPIGYTDRGQGQPKAIDPAQAPLVKQTFEMYAAGRYGLRALEGKMHELGLRGKNGARLTRSSLHGVLRNPFYTGLIRLKKTGELFQGMHEPIVSKFLFDRVQLMLDGKHVDKRHRHSFLFRKHIVCDACQKNLIPETQKGHIYYRCQTRECPEKTVREEVAETAFVGALQRLRFSDDELRYLGAERYNSLRLSSYHEEDQRKALRLRLEQIRVRLSKLADAYIDSVLDQEMYVHKKNSLLLEEQTVMERLENLGSEGNIRERVEGFLELANKAHLSYQSGIFEERRELVKTVTSNFVRKGKFVIPKLHYPFELVAERHKSFDGGPRRDVARTLSPLLSALYDYVAKDPGAMPLDVLNGNHNFLSRAA
jgi:DNA invertase Pin-like site-specific DNA recombinase